MLEDIASFGERGTRGAVLKCIINLVDCVAVVVQLAGDQALVARVQRCLTKVSAAKPARVRKLGLVGRRVLLKVVKFVVVASDLVSRDSCVARALAGRDGLRARVAVIARRVGQVGVLQTVAARRVGGVRIDEDTVGGLSIQVDGAHVDHGLAGAQIAVADGGEDVVGDGRGVGCIVEAGVFYQERVRFRVFEDQRVAGVCDGLEVGEAGKADGRGYSAVCGCGSEIARGA
jgi:hypothetical protein